LIALLHCLACGRDRLELKKGRRGRERRKH